MGLMIHEDDPISTAPPWGLAQRLAPTPGHHTDRFGPSIVVHFIGSTLAIAGDINLPCEATALEVHSYWGSAASRMAQMRFNEPLALFHFRAACNGVLPLELRKVGSAPKRSRPCTNSASPSQTASCSGW